MPVVNPLVREIVFKLVYYGPGLGGKTTTLQHIHKSAKAEYCGKMVSLATPVDRTLYFDFLPLRVPSVRGLKARLQLYTVPGQVYYNATRKLVLTGVDGVVLVCDSQRSRLDANLESIENLRDNLRAHSRVLERLPHALQYNKRDLSDVLSVEELNRALNRHDAPAFATTATSGEGVYEALESITRAMLEAMEDYEKLPSDEITAKHELPEGSLMEVLRRAEENEALAEAAATQNPVSTRVTADAPAQSTTASFAELWPLAERDTVRELERALALGELAHAVTCTERLVTRTLARAAARAGGTDARDPGAVALLLGLPGHRYLELRALARDARAGKPIASVDALRAYATAIEARLLRERVTRA